jgi:hypothetical protein
MAESKTLEMRMAELEDKLSKVYITEDEMKAYHKVASALGSAAGASGTALSPQVCVAACTIHHACITANCIIQQCVISACIRQQCINECSCGPCAPMLQGGIGRGGGFGTLGG